MTLRSAYFEDLYSGPKLLFWGDAEGMSQLRDFLRDPRLWHSLEQFCMVADGRKITVRAVSNWRDACVDLGPDSLEWRLDPASADEFAEKVAVLVSEKGHQYLDSPEGDIEVMVSHGEYPENFVEIVEPQMRDMPKQQTDAFDKVFASLKQLRYVRMRALDDDGKEVSVSWSQAFWHWNRPSDERQKFLNALNDVWPNPAVFINPIDDDTERELIAFSGVEKRGDALIVSRDALPSVIRELYVGNWAMLFFAVGHVPADLHWTERLVDASATQAFLKKTNATAGITSGPDNQDWQMFFRQGTRAWLRKSAVRCWIIESINRILAGDSFNEDDFNAQPTEGWEQIKSATSFIRSDRNPAHSAWLALQRWINDDDIRAKDPTYANNKKRELRELLRMIEDEVA
jgi:hypothetical protein